MFCSAGAVTTVVTIEAVWLAFAYVAVMTVVVATLEVLMANVMLLDPAVIVTLAGTVTAVVLLESVMTAPPVGAAAVRVIVPLTAFPPTTEFADTTMLDKAPAVGAVVAAEPAHPERTVLASRTELAQTATPRHRMMRLNAVHAE